MVINYKDEEISTIDSEVPEGDEATISLIQTLVMKDEQFSGSDKATLDLVQSLQTEELNNVTQSANDIDLSEDNFPPLKPNQ